MLFLPLRSCSVTHGTEPVILFERSHAATAQSENSRLHPLKFLLIVCFVEMASSVTVSPAVKRLLKDLRELEREPSSFGSAKPIDDANVFEWYVVQSVARISRFVLGT